MAGQRESAEETAVEKERSLMGEGEEAAALGFEGLEVGLEGFAFVGFVDFAFFLGGMAGGYHRGNP